MADAGGLHKRALTSLADHDGVLDEILARLPVKSLMRFRCVCKSWRALISQSHFVTKHFTYATQGITESTSRLLFSTSPVESIDYEALKDLNDADSHLAIRKLKFPVMFPDSSITTITGSCNGLICVDVDLEGIAIWNPCAGESNVLPKRTDDCTHDDYKVVRGHNYRVRGSEETVVQVFSSKSGSWRTHEGLDYFNLAGRGYLLNGVLHWLETTFTDIIVRQGRGLSHLI
ncbi:putative F-box domain-containing protein [Rosa chinensis]|uniref:Putative F-box domain-containing protein n=1 Tax=Rosa chinensis TaxID=74649 RepID=A0A2P6SF69_ROSCH|nr:F-box/kelch-repeat protein At3g23880 [Rosa chinensis]PRQ57328.1 putative F-box domain-containing protein [Rosa chinensis]